MSQSETNVNKNSGKFWAPDAIFDRRDLSSTQKLILLNLHRRADRNGECHPGHARIAQDCGFKSRATVLRNLPPLIEAGTLKAIRGRLGYRYFLVSHDKWPKNKPDNPPAVALSEPSKKRLKVTSDVTLSHITKRLKVTQRTPKKESTKKDPPTPHKHPTETERLVSEFEKRGGTFLKTRQVIEQFRAEGLGEQYLTAALRELEQTRQKEGVRSVPVLLGEKILPRFMEKQAEEREEQQRKLKREQEYRDKKKREEAERDLCQKNYVPGTLTALTEEATALMKAAKATGQIPVTLPQAPPPQLQQRAA